MAATVDNGDRNRKFIAFITKRTLMPPPNKLYDVELDYAGVYDLAKKYGGWALMKKSKNTNVFFHDWYAFTNEGASCTRSNIRRGITVLRGVVDLFTMFMEDEGIVEDDDPNNGVAEASQGSCLSEGACTTSRTIVDEFAKFDALKDLIQTFLVNAQSKSNLVGQDVVSEYCERVESVQMKLLSPPLRSLAFFGESNTGKTYVMDSMLRISEISHVDYEKDEIKEWAAMTDLEEMCGFPLEVSVVPLVNVRSEKSNYAVVMPPTLSTDTIWFVTNKEREAERINSEVWAKLEKSDVDKKDVGSFLLRKADAGQGMATTQHNLRIRYGAKYQILIEYETREEIYKKLAGFKFRNDAKKVADETSDERDGEELQEESRKSEEQIMEALLNGVAKSYEFKNGNNAITFKDEAERCFGKVLAFLSNGKNATDDRIYIRRILNQLMFHGLNMHGAQFNEPANAKSGDASTMLIKSIWVYAPSALLHDVEWIDCPGCNDADPVREQLLQKTLNECDSLIFLSSKMDSKAALQTFKKYIVPRLDFDTSNQGIAAGSNVTKLNSFSFAFMNERERSLKTEFNSEVEFQQKNKELRERVWACVSPCLSHANKLSPKVQMFFSDSAMQIFPGAYTALIQRHIVNRQELLKFASGRRLIDFLRNVSSTASVPDELRVLVDKANNLASNLPGSQSLLGRIDFSTINSYRTAPWRRTIVISSWRANEVATTKLLLENPEGFCGLKDLTLPCNTYLASLEPHRGQFKKLISNRQAPMIKLGTLAKAFSKSGTAHAARALEAKNVYFKRFATFLATEIDFYIEAEEKFAKAVTVKVLSILCVFTKKMYGGILSEVGGTQDDVSRASVAVDAYFNSGATRASATPKIHAGIFKDTLERRRKSCRENIGTALQDLFYETFTFSDDDQKSRENLMEAYDKKHEEFARKVRDDGYVRQKLLGIFAEKTWKLALEEIVSKQNGTTICRDILFESLSVLDPVARAHGAKLARDDMKTLLQNFSIKLKKQAVALQDSTTAERYEEVFLQWRTDGSSAGATETNVKDGGRKIAKLSQSA